MLAFLHTSPIHIERFENLVRKYNNTISTKHFVNEALLKESSSTGLLDLKSFTSQIQEIKKHPVQLIICTCTTYGQASEAFENVKRIDQPLVEYLISNFSKIAMAYTVLSTRDVSKSLLEKTAIAKNKKMEIIEFDCTSSWQYFEAGDIENYEKSIAKQIRKTTLNVDVIFFAQASMEGAIQYLKDLEIEIFSIPEFGIKSFLKKIKTLD